MILIFSITNDYSTSMVINWLIRLNKPFIRINEDTEVELVSLNAEDFILNINNKTIYSNQIHKIWYRRGGLNFNKSFCSEIIGDYLSAEKSSLVQYLYHRLDKIPSINNFKTRDINKLYLLELCKKHNVKFPDFLVTNSKEMLLNFYNKQAAIISKPFIEPFSIIDEEENIHLAYTKEVTLEEIVSLPEKFVPTFFQKKINKRYEIRAFYLEGEIFAMAIFSQNNKNTSVDFRNYDNAKPNRTTPYKFPIEYETKLIELLKSFHLNCASFDVVYSTDDSQYYFLDLNPIGQFGMVSMPCNYNLEKKIAINL